MTGTSDHITGSLASFSRQDYAHERKKYVKRTWLEKTWVSREGGKERRESMFGEDIGGVMSIGWREKK